MSNLQMTDLMTASPALESEEVVIKKVAKYDVRKPNSYSAWAWALLIFIIIAVITWVILYVAAPGWVQKKDPIGRPTGQVDPVSAIVAAILISLLITFLVYILYLFFAPSACEVIIERA